MADQHRNDAPLERVGLRTFRAQMKAYLDQARQGRSFAVTSHGVVIAELRPPSLPEPPRRRPGALKDRIRMAEDVAEASTARQGDDE